MIIPRLSRAIVRSSVGLMLVFAVIAIASSPFAAMAKDKAKIHDSSNSKKHGKKKAAAAVAAAVIQMTPDMAPSPALVSSYRGDPKHILARSAWGDFSEADLFLYLLVSKADVPLVYPKYLAAAPGLERDALRKRVEKALSNMALDADLARESSAASTDPLDDIRLRLGELQVDELVWIDRVLIPKNEVRPEDVQKYIIDNPSSTTVPSRATVRYIFLNVPTEAPTAVERDTAAKMDRIRDSIASGKISFEDAARQFSQAPSAADGGLISDFEAGSFFTAFEDRAFGLAPGEMSPVIFGPNGLYLVKAISVKPEETVTSDKLEAYIRQKLFFRQLQHRYTYAIGRLRLDSVIEDRASLIDTLDPGARVIRAGKFTLTADQLWELFPSFVDENLVVNKGLMAAQAERLINLELIAQYNDKNGLASDPSLEKARSLSSNLVRAGKKLRELVESQLAVSDEKQVEAAMKAHPENFLGVSAPRFSLVQIRILHPGGLSASQLLAKKTRIRSMLESARDRYTSVSLAQVASTWKGGTIAPADLIPSRIEEELTKSADRSVDITRWDLTQSDAVLPEATRTSLQDVRTRLAEIIKQHSRFLPIVDSDDSLLLYYVEQPDLTIPAVRNLQRAVFRQLASQSLGADAVERLRAQRQANGKFTLTIP